MEKPTPRDIYQEGLDARSAAEKKLKDHPLQTELAAHQELKKEFPATAYPLQQEEDEASAELAKVRAEIQKIEEDLLRQLGNAQTEGKKINESMKRAQLVRKVLPEIAKVKESIQNQLAENENLPRRAQSFGRQVLIETEKAERDITSQKPIPKPSDIESWGQIIQALHNEFLNYARDVFRQNRYGEDVAG